MVAIKKIIIIAAACLLIAGVKVLDGGLAPVRYAGVNTAFDGGYQRLDFEGGGEEAQNALKDLNARLLWTEETEGIMIYYAYTPQLPRFETVKGQKVNIMAAVRAGAVSIGTPLLKGSY